MRAFVFRFELAFLSAMVIPFVMLVLPCSLIMAHAYRSVCQRARAWSVPATTQPHGLGALTPKATCDAPGGRNVSAPDVKGGHDGR